MLEAAGYVDVESIARTSADALWRELNQANEMLRLMRSTPDRDEVSVWIREARQLVGVDGVDLQETVAPVNHEENPQLQAVLPLAPFAIPLPAKVFMENRVRVGEIPPAILLNRHQGDLDVRTDQWVPQTQGAAKSARSAPAPQTSQYVMFSDAPASRLEIDTAKVKPLSSQSGERRRKSGRRNQDQAPEQVVDDRLDLLRAPRPETNRGRTPESRLYIRGVLHTHPKSIWFGAWITLVTGVWLPASILAGVLLLLSDQSPANFGWVPPWVLWFPVMLPVIGGSYLIWGLGGSCRICGQKLFVHRPHRKHIKAHHVRLMGYIIPLCVHILLFRWFRCTHCGTPVRLKE